MKWMTWTLLAANLLVAGFFIGREYLPQTGSNETVPMNVDRLSLRSQAGSATSEEPPKGAVAPKAFCIEWRGLNQGEFTQVREQFKAMANERVCPSPRCRSIRDIGSFFRLCPALNRQLPN